MRDTVAYRGDAMPPEYAALTPGQKKMDRSFMPEPGPVFPYLFVNGAAFRVAGPKAWLREESLKLAAEQRLRRRTIEKFKLEEPALRTRIVSAIGIKSLETCPCAAYRVASVRFLTTLQQSHLIAIQESPNSAFHG